MVWELTNFILLKPIRKLLLKRVEGIENIPNPPFILASNHTSILDHFMIIKVIYDRFRKKVHFLADNGRFRHVFGDLIFVRYAGCIPTSLPNGEMYSKVKSTLNRKEIVGIFPEGYYTSDGTIKRFKKGVGKICKENNVPLVPVAIKGAHEICPAPKLFPKLKKNVRMKIGKPVKFYNSKKSEKKIVLEIEDIVKGLFRSL